MIKQKRFDWFFAFSVAVFLALVGVAINTAFYRSIKAQDDVGDVTTEVASLGPREIILVRNNLIVGTYGGNRTSADLGASLVTAMAACQDGDVLYTGPGEYEVENLEIDDAIEWIAQGTVCIPVATDTDWGRLVFVNASDVTIRGLKCDGKHQSNDGFGNGIFSAFGADRLKFYDLECNNMDGGTTSQGRGLYVSGDDIIIDGYSATDNKYIGIRASNANNLQIRNAFIYNSGATNGAAGAGQNDPRSIEIDGSLSEEKDFVSLENVYCLSTTDQGQAYIGINVAAVSQIRNLNFNNVHIVNRDNISAGVSYDIATRMQTLKIQNCDNVSIKNSSFIHGDNQNGGGSVVAFAFDATFPSRIHFDVCTFSSGFFNMGSSSVDKMSFTGCAFGVDSADTGAIAAGLGGGQFEFVKCHFNCRDLTTAFVISSASPGSEDYIKIVDSTFVANKATDVALFANSTNDLLSDPRLVIFAGNTLTNSGAGDLVRSADTDIAVLLRTDRTGNIIHDDSDSQYSDPGAGPTNFFTGVPGAYAGQKIINEEYNGSGTKYWVYNGSNWIVGDS